MLPQAHTCTNCLELPDYYGALLAVGGGESSRCAAVESGRLSPEATERLHVRCRDVVRERLEYAVVNGAGVYGLDE